LGEAGEALAVNNTVMHTQSRVAITDGGRTMIIVSCQNNKVKGKFVRGFVDDFLWQSLFWQG
jgi:hypothetical protein